jgi:hypothetical protein
VNKNNQKNKINTSKKNMMRAAKFQRRENHGLDN